MRTPIQPLQQGMGNSVDLQTARDPGVLTLPRYGLGAWLAGEPETVMLFVSLTQVRTGHNSRRRNLPCLGIVLYVRAWR